MRTPGSDADYKIWLRCPSCGEHSVRPLEWSRRHANFPCDKCSSFVDLTSGENLQAIKGMSRARRRQPSRG